SLRPGANREGSLVGRDFHLNTRLRGKFPLPLAAFSFSLGRIRCTQPRILRLHSTRRRAFIRPMIIKQSQSWQIEVHRQSSGELTCHIGGNPPIITD
ncbi:hypothetical protein TMatcc_001605, partial [Talaromyces marneffei ATCC 18224]